MIITHIFLVYIRVGSWCSTFSGFGQMYNGMCHHHSVLQNIFPALKVLRAPPFCPSLPLAPGNQISFSLGTPFIFWTFLPLAPADSNLTEQRGQQMCSPSSSWIDPSPKAQTGAAEGGPHAGWALGSQLSLLGTFAAF